jgi:hypothetical protein
MAGKRKRQNRTGDDGDDFLKICGIDIRPDLFFSNIGHNQPTLFYSFR